MSFETEVQRRNEEFRNASPAEKRVLIAKDVIAQIQQGRIIPKKGLYLNIFNARKDLNIQEDFLRNKEVTCAACGVGALFLSCTLYKNEVKYRGVPSYYMSKDSVEASLPEDILCDYKERDFKNGLQEIFGRTTLSRIEYCFEGYDRYKEYLERHPSDEERLILIMQNIIDNNGEFTL